MLNCFSLDQYQKLPYYNSYKFIRFFKEIYRWDKLVLLICSFYYKVFKDGGPARGKKKEHRTEEKKKTEA
jgi:hypothetical protein